MRRLLKASLTKRCSDIRNLDLSLCRTICTAVLSTIQHCERNAGLDYMASIKCPLHSYQYLSTKYKIFQNRHTPQEWRNRIEFTYCPCVKFIFKETFFFKTYTFKEATLSIVAWTQVDKKNHTEYFPEWKESGLSKRKTSEFIVSTKKGHRL